MSYNITDLSRLQEEISVQTYYNNITEAITRSLNSAQICEKENKRHKILPVRTTTLLQRRKELQETKNKPPPIKNELAALYKLVNKYIINYYAKPRKDIIEKTFKPHR